MQTKKVTRPAPPKPVEPRPPEAVEKQEKAVAQPPADPVKKEDSKFSILLKRGASFEDAKNYPAAMDAYESAAKEISSPAERAELKSRVGRLLEKTRP